MFCHAAEQLFLWLCGIQLPNLKEFTTLWNYQFYVVCEVVSHVHLYQTLNYLLFILYMGIFQSTAPNAEELRKELDKKGIIIIQYIILNIVPQQ